MKLYLEIADFRRASKTLLLFIFLLSACQKQPINYYRGTVPEYRLSPDGRYYPVDPYGKFMPLSMDYRAGSNDGIYYYPCPVNGADNEPPAMYGTKWLEKKSGDIPEAFAGWKTQIEQAKNQENGARRTEPPGAGTKQPVILQGQTCPVEPIPLAHMQSWLKQNRQIAPGQVVRVPPPERSTPSPYAVPPAALSYDALLSEVTTPMSDDNDTAYQIPDNAAVPDSATSGNSYQSVWDLY